MVGSAAEVPAAQRLGLQVSAQHTAGVASGAKSRVLGLSRPTRPGHSPAACLSAGGTMSPPQVRHVLKILVGLPVKNLWYVVCASSVSVVCENFKAICSPKGQGAGLALCCILPHCAFGLSYRPLLLCGHLVGRPR